MPPQNKSVDDQFGPAETIDDQFGPAETVDNATESGKSVSQSPDYSDLATDLNTREGVEHIPLQFLMGAGKGLGSTLWNIGHLATAPTLAKQPGMPSFIHKMAIGDKPQMLMPKGDIQPTGFDTEQAAEFLAPGPAEDKAVSMVPDLMKPAVRVGLGALSTGAVNKSQGGSFKSGAELGSAAGLMGEGMRLMAPSLAESSIGITRKDRGFGKTPGRAILEDTSGIAPGTVAGNADLKAKQLTSELENRAAAQSLQVLSGKAQPASTQPALDVIDREMVKAKAQNAGAYYRQLSDIRSQLTHDFDTGIPLGVNQTPTNILNLKRGINKLEGSWNPEQKGAARGIVRQVYGALDSELDRSVPGAQELNQRISSLIPVSQRAESTERGAGMGQRMGHRIAAHTGALAASIPAGMLGYEKGGAPGAAMGAGLGILVPEMLASPSAQMMGARLMASPTTARLGRGVVGATLLGKNPNKKNGNGK